MIGNFGARRHADVFAALVDGDTPERAASVELAQFAAIVSSIRDLDDVEMRPDFSAGLRERLMAEAPEALAGIVADEPPTPLRATRPASARRQRIVRVAAATCLVVGVTGGVAAASQSALPGDPLYGVKRALERLEIGLDGSDASKGEDLVDQARTRLDEVNDLATTKPDDPNTTRLIEDTLADFSDQANQGADSLISSYEETSDPDTIVDLREFTSESADELDDLSSVIPADARDDLVDAAGDVIDIDQDARDTCAACSPLVPVVVSDTILDLAAGDGGLLGSPGTDIPGNDPGSGGGDQPGKPDKGGATQGLPTDALPTLPDVTGGGGDPTKPGGGDHTGGGDQTSKPPVQLPTVPLPSVPLPSVPLPSVPLPSVPLPTVPAPSLPLPTLALPTLHLSDL